MAACHSRSRKKRKNGAWQSKRFLWKKYFKKRSYHPHWSPKVYFGGCVFVQLLYPSHPGSKISHSLEPWFSTERGALRTVGAVRILWTTGNARRTCGHQECCISAAHSLQRRSLNPLTPPPLQLWTRSRGKLWKQTHVGLLGENIPK